MGGSSGGGGTTTSVTNSEPWSEQKPYLATGFESALTDVLNRPRSYFPDSTVVPYSPETMSALSAQSNRALQGSPLLGGAQDYTGDVLGGEYLSAAPSQAGGYTGDVLSGKYLDPESNPFLANVQDSVLSQVQPQVAGTFARAGRTGGSPLAAEALGRGVSRGMAPYLFGEYGRERGIMEGAAGREYDRFSQERGVMENAANRAPGLAREDYFDIGQLANVGAARELKADEGLQDSISRWNFAQAEPTERLGQYMNMIGGGYGGTSTGSQTSSQSSNPLLTGLGLGMSGLSTAGGLGWSPLGK